MTLIFDFDGLILDTEWPIYLTWKNLFEQHNQSLSLEDYVKCIGSDFDTWSPETHLETLTRESFDWPALNHLRNLTIRQEVAKLQPLPGIRETLQAAKESEIRLAVVSSSSRDWVEGWLEKLDLLPFFETAVCRGDAPRIKPAPDLYLEALRRLAIDPAKACVLEDSHNGLLAAKAAGLPVAIIPNRITRLSDFASADFILHSAHEIIPQVVPNHPTS